jgi:hypothetical protein
MDKQVIISGKVKRAFYLLTVFLCIFPFVLLGCNKEKATAPKGKGPAETCEILDKLPKDVSKAVEVDFGNRIKLVGVTVKKEAQDKLQVSYYWQAKDELEAYNMVFVHFTDKDNKGIFQNDHPFCQQTSVEELKGKVVKETFKIGYPKNAVGQEIFVKIGLYDPKSGRRLKIESHGETPADDGDTRAIVERLKL